MSRQALTGYRRLLRARTVAFAGDQEALEKSAVALRAAFLENRSESSADKLAELMREVDQAEEMLRFHILQGKKNEKGNFDVPIPKDKAQRMSAHDQMTHIDEEHIPPEPKPLIETHKPPPKTH